MTDFLAPVLVLILWTLVICAVMYVRRIPAMNRITRDTQEFVRKPELMDQLPPRVRWAADNFNHLHEQPVIFYALMFYLYLSNLTGPVLLGMAWAYVALRVVHSLVQISSNKVLIRFSLFVLSAIILLLMAIYALGYQFGFLLGDVL